MVISDILYYGSPEEVCKNYTIGYGIEVNPKRKMFYFTTKLS